MINSRINDPLCRFCFMGIRVWLKSLTRYSENTVPARVLAYYSQRKYGENTGEKRNRNWRLSHSGNLEMRTLYFFPTAVNGLLKDINKRNLDTTLTLRS